MGIVRITDAATEPVALAGAKVHLRVDAGFTDDDALITALIAATRQSAEDDTHRALITQTWRLSLDDFPRACSSIASYSVVDGRVGQRNDIQVIRVPQPPLQSVTSIKYIDTSGAQQTLDPSAYVVDADAFPGRILPAYGTTWPSVRCGPNAVVIEFKAGYGDTADKVPPPITAAMLLAIGDLYRNRESQIVGATITDNPTVKALLGPYRYREFV